MAYDQNDIPDYTIIDDPYGDVRLPPEQMAPILAAEEMKKGKGKGVGIPESYLRGFNRAFDRFGFGVQDLLIPKEGKLREGFNRASGAARQDFLEAAEQNPVAAHAGDFAGSAAKGIYDAFAMATGLGGATRLPMVGQGIQQAANFIGKSPLASGVLGGASAGAIQGALDLPEEGTTRGGNALLGAGIGAGFGGLVPGAAKTAGGLANFAKRHFLGDEDIVLRDIIKSMTPKELQTMFKRKQAGDTLGVHLTPAEASGSNLAQKLQKQIRGGDDLTKDFYEFAELRRESEQDALDRFVDMLNPKRENYNERVRDTAFDIMDKNKKSIQKEAKPFYAAAEKEVVPDEQFNKLMEDPFISMGYQQIYNDPEYIKVLQGLDPKSIKVLDLVQQKMRRKGDALLSNFNTEGDNFIGGQYLDSQKRLVGSLEELSDNYRQGRAIYAEDMPGFQKKLEGELGKLAETSERGLKNIGKVIFDPQQTDINRLVNVRNEFLKPGDDYAQRAEVWKGMIANEFERRVDTVSKEATGNVGSAIYKNVFRNKSQYDKFEKALEPFPEELEKLKAFKVAFKDLVNKPTIKTEAGRADVGVDKFRNWFDFLNYSFRKGTGDTYAKTMVKIITDPKYDTMIKRALENKDSNVARNKLAEIIVGATDGGYLQQALTGGTLGLATE
jgi:hypothetical protein